MIHSSYYYFCCFFEDFHRAWEHCRPIPNVIFQAVPSLTGTWDIEHYDHNLMFSKLDWSMLWTLQCLLLAFKTPQLSQSLFPNHFSHSLPPIISVPVQLVHNRPQSLFSYCPFCWRGSPSPCHMVTALVCKARPSSMFWAKCSLSPSVHNCFSWEPQQQVKGLSLKRHLNENSWFSFVCAQSILYFFSTLQGQGLCQMSLYPGCFVKFLA